LVSRRASLTGWRKTTLGLAIAIEGAIRGENWFWGAPTFDQVRIGWAEAKHGAGGVATFTQQRMTCEMPTGGRIIYRSLDDPDNARGHTADGIIIDEAGSVKPEAWYEVIRPMLIDTGGDAWLIGTPNGRNWFYREHMHAHDRDDSACWQIPTLGCEIVDGALIRRPHPLENPNIPFDEIDHLYQTTPERTFRQEILAEFVEGEGAVFRNIKACLHSIDDTPEMHAGHTIVMGVDWGKVDDFTVLSVGCRECNREIALDRFHGVEYRLQRQRLASLAERWGVSEILAESNAMGVPIIEELQYSGLPVTGFLTTATSKPPLIESLVLCFEREEGQFIDNAVATAELEAYELKTNANTGRPTYSAPDGMHDDTVIARALMWKLLLTAGPWMTIL
jgi:hypothetical protein